jgi:hypothetical protein
MQLEIHALYYIILQKHKKSPRREISELVLLSLGWGACEWIIATFAWFALIGSLAEAKDTVHDWDEEDSKNTKDGGLTELLSDAKSGDDAESESTDAWDQADEEEEPIVACDFHQIVHVKEWDDRVPSWLAGLGEDLPHANNGNDNDC